MTIQETIDHLNELRKEEYGTTIHLMSEKPRKEKLEFLSELAENYDQLRKAALAGAEQIGPGTYSASWEAQRDAALDTYKKSV